MQPAASCQHGVGAERLDAHIVCCHEPCPSKQKEGIHSPPALPVYLQQHGRRCLSG
jgi:hypothetical protein